MKKILIIAIALVILLAAIGVGLFVSYNMMKDQPANSFKTIRNAIAEHDKDTFYSMVDIDAVLNTAAEEILVEQLNQDTTNYSMQQLANTYNNELKPDFISVTKRAVDEYLTTGRVNLDGVAMTNTQRWLKRAGINSCSIIGISKPAVMGQNGSALIMFHNDALDFSFELELELERNADQTGWRVVNAKGFTDYDKALKRALDKKLAALNAPIYAQLNAIVDVHELNARIGEGDEYGFSQTLKIAMKADVKADKPLARIVGKIVIGYNDDSASPAPFVIDMAYHPTGLQTFNIDKILNPFVRAYVDIMKHGLRRSALRAEIDEVDFLDGTVLKVLDQLPD